MIERAAPYYNSEVPERHKEEFFKYIKGLKNNNFKINELGFDLNEVGDNILKVIYVWNNSDKKETQADFNTKVQECIVDRNTIISGLSIINNIENPKETEDWNVILGD